MARHVPCRPRTRCARTAAGLILFVVISATGGAAPPGDPASGMAPTASAIAAAHGLTAEELAAPRTLERVAVLQWDEAAVLMADADAAVFLPDRGELWRVSPAGAAAAGEARTLARGAAGPARAATREPTTLGGFLQLVADVLSRTDTAGGERYLLKLPDHRPLPGAVPPARAHGLAATTGDVVFESFEGDPWSRWNRWDSTSGQYTWGTTACGAHHGALSADAVRGGAAGPALGCSSDYPNNIANGFIDTYCEDLTGAGEAWLDLWADLEAELGYDRLGFFFLGSDDVLYGYSFTGSLGGWFNVIANLRQWYHLRDLTQNSCNRFAVYFESDSSVAGGFGARVDQLRIRTDSGAALRCSASASPVSGPAPLTVNFTGTVSGATNPVFTWFFDDGSTSSSQNPSHTYTEPGEYWADFYVQDGQASCDALVLVTVTSGGGGGGGGGGGSPQNGTYVGSTAQGYPFELDVTDGKVTRWKFGFSCDGVSGTAEVNTTNCPISDGSFSCGSSSCPAAGTNTEVSGTFDTDTHASGTLGFATRPTVGASCCGSTGVSWSASLQGSPTLTASASASPTSGQAPLTVSFTGSASGGTPPYQYAWQFGDGGSSTEQSPSHTYSSPGTYTAILTVSDAASGSASDSVTITVSEAPGAAYRYLVPAVAHNPGYGGTLWRTDIAAVNRSSATANVTLSLHSSSGTATASATIPAGSTVEWANILETVFGVGAGDNRSGCLEVSSDQPLSITSRTFNQGPEGTYGQYLPALSADDALRDGETGILPQLKRNSTFRTNVGIVNLGSATCSVLVQLYDASGSPVGSPRTLTAGPGEWTQENDIFSKAGAGSHDVAYATVQVTTPGGSAWAYASVVDGDTGDPTTVPVVRPGAAGGDAAFESADAADDPPRARVDAPGDATGRARSAATSSPYAGYWYGTTSQDLPVTFHVSDSGTIDELRFRFRLYTPIGYCDVDAASPDPVPLSGNSFHATVHVQSSDITSNVDGTFSSPTAASGSYSGYSGPHYFKCGSILFESNAGTPLTGGSWTAAHETAPPLTATASADPTSGDAPLEVQFTGEASGGTPPYDYHWNFGDGSSSDDQNPTHTYHVPGAYDAVLSVQDEHNSSASDTVRIEVSGAVASPYRYLVPAVAHNPGAAGTMWRSDVAAVNPGTDPANLTLRFDSGGGPSSPVSVTLPPGGAVEWANVLETVFGLSPSSKASGTLEVGSDVPLVVSARTYNSTPSGTFGQFLPGLTPEGALTGPETALLPQIKKNLGFRTNVGAVNLGDEPATVDVELYGSSGLFLGRVSIPVQPGQWEQANDVFGTVGAGSQDIAYAVVNIQGGAGSVWVYASVVDQQTGDPTTIPMLVP